jgi:hypothetical protein
LAKRARAFKSEKRRKEVMRQKKQEEKRQKRQKKDVLPSTEPDGVNWPVSEPEQASETSE